MNGAPNASDLLNLARQKLYTKNGEMFSALNLFELVKSAVNDDIGTNLKLFEGKLYCDEIKQVLRSGGCLLVPYPFTLAKILFLENDKIISIFKVWIECYLRYLKNVNAKLFLPVGFCVDLDPNVIFLGFSFLHSSLE